MHCMGYIWLFVWRPNTELHSLHVYAENMQYIVLWWGFGFGVKFGLLSTTIFWLTGNAAVVSGLSVVNYWLAVSIICGRSSGTQTSLTNSWHGNLNFSRVIYFRFRSGICFQSHFYIRDSGGTTASRVCVAWGPWKGSVLRDLPR